MASNAEKLAAIEREIRYRRRVYGRMVEREKLTAGFAAAQIQLFEEIAEDYRALAKQERLL